jgi:hypothetical protein
MKRALPIAALWILLLSPTLFAQQKSKNEHSPSQLDLTAEVATTTNEGYPSTLRITLKNVGNVPVDLPFAPEACNPDGGIEVEMQWAPSGADRAGTGWGHGCGTSDLPPLSDRVRNEWIRLRPGEYFVFTKKILDQLSGLKSGALEYWVVFTPPTAAPAEVAKLREEGYIIPTEKLETSRNSFPIH